MRCRVDRLPFLGTLFGHSQNLGDAIDQMIAPRDDTMPAFKHLLRINLSYLRHFRGQECGFDASLLEYVAAIPEGRT